MEGKEFKKQKKQKKQKFHMRLYNTGCFSASYERVSSRTTLFEEKQ